MIYRKSKDMYIVHVYLSHSHIREFNASHVFVTANHCPQTKNILNLCQMDFRSCNRYKLLQLQGH